MIRMTDAQRHLVESNLRLVYAGMKKYRRSDIDLDLMEADFNFALCRAAMTYKPEKGTFGSWAFWHFYNAFMALLRARHRRGITTTRTDIKTINMPMTKCRKTPSATSMESSQENGQLREMRRAHNEGARIERFEMVTDYQSRMHQLSESQRQIIEARMQGMDYKTIGQQQGCSKQNAADRVYAAIRELGLTG